MINEKTLKQLVVIAMVIVLVFFTILILRPVAMAIIFGLVLAYILNPVYKIILKIFRNKTISASITCIIVLSLFFVSIWFLIPVLASQIFDSYSAVQSWDVLGLFKRFFPFLFTSEQITSNFIAAYNNFVTNTVNTTLHKLTDFLVDLPGLLLKSLVVLIVFFYSLRDGDKLIKLIKETLPFKRDITNKFIKKSKDVTFSVVFGRVVIGILTGILTGISFFLAGVNNSILLTFLSITAAIIPIIGPWIVWIPVVISLFIAGETVTAFILFLYCGLFISFVDNILHAVIISKQTHIPTSLTLIGLIGGLFLFGIFGIILGPLIVAYLGALFEIYRDYNKKIQNESKSKTL